MGPRHCCKATQAELVARIRECVDASPRWDAAAAVVLLRVVSTFGPRASLPYLEAMKSFIFFAALLGCSSSSSAPTPSDAGSTAPDATGAGDNWSGYAQGFVATYCVE